LRLVVDANILLAAFLKEAVTRELLLDPRLSLFAPEHLVEETSHHLNRNASIRRRIGLSDRDLQELFSLLTLRIQVIPMKSYQSFLKEALVFAPHEEDAPYLALAMHLSVPIWSNDQGFKDQDNIRVYSTRKLLSVLG
jgi:predicted nucleic acid-binding protein